VVTQINYRNTYFIMTIISTMNTLIFILYFLCSYEWKGALTFALLFLYSLSNIETKDVSEMYNEADEISNKSFVQFCNVYSNLLIEQVS